MMIVLLFMVTDDYFMIAANYQRSSCDHFMIIVNYFIMTCLCSMYKWGYQQTFFGKYLEN